MQQTNEFTILETNIQSPFLMTGLFGRNVERMNVPHTSSSAPAAHPQTTTQKWLSFTFQDQLPVRRASCLLKFSSFIKKQ